jgi:hypothetical protein
MRPHHNQTTSERGNMRTSERTNKQTNGRYSELANDSFVHLLVSSVAYTLCIERIASDIVVCLFDTLTISVPPYFSS